MVSGDGSTPDVPPRRAVIIGASNVALGIGSLITTCHHAWGQPLEYFIAAGHGRALGEYSTVLGRILPPVLECRLWEAWRRRPAVPTAALVTDIGTDLIFGASAQQVVDRAAECLRRIRPHCDRLVVTKLPVDSVAALSPRAFRFARRMLFPSSRLQRDDAVQAMQQINQALLEFPAQFHCYLLAPSIGWFGRDPIHIRRRCFPDAWQSFLAPWHDFRAIPRSRRDGIFSTLRLWRQLRPMERVVWKKKQTTTQPCARTKDGSLFWVY